MVDDYAKHARRFSVSYMSNAKWQKLFIARARSGVEIEHAEWSYIDSQHTEIMRLPAESDLLDDGFSDVFGDVATFVALY